MSGRSEKSAPGVSLGGEEYRVVVVRSFSFVLRYKWAHATSGYGAMAIVVVARSNVSWSRSYRREAR